MTSKINWYYGEYRGALPLKELTLTTRLQINNGKGKMHHDYCNIYLLYSTGGFKGGARVSVEPHRHEGLC